MAKAQKNIVIQGIRGTIGNQLVFRQGKNGRTIISKKPTFADDRVFSEAQKEHHGSFKEAAAYAKAAAKTEPIYAELAAGEYHSAYNAALADWFHRPEVGEIDLSGWTGQVGGSIRIEAVDNVKVVQVTVMIADEQGVVIEQGEAEQVDGLWWVYTTTQAVPGAARVIAVARDLPGHIGQGMAMK